MKKVVIFDLDGVLCDTIPFQMEYTLQHYPTLTRESWRALSNGNFHKNWEKFIKNLVDYIPLSPEEKEKRIKEFSKQKALCPIFPGILELLTDLHSNGFVIALNTSAWKMTSAPLLKKGGILHLFDYMGTAEVSKSKVEKFSLIAVRYQVDPKNMLFVADTIGDIAEAQEAGVPTVAVTWGIHDKESFNNCKFLNLVGIAESMEKLSKLIYQSFNK